MKNEFTFSVCVLACCAVLFAQIHAAVIDIEQFGAVANNKTVDQALANGRAIRSALLAADELGNDDPSSSTVLVQAGKEYWVLPDQPVDGIDSVTLQIDGTLSALVDLVSWPNDTSGGALNFMAFTDSSNIRITSSGSGLISGNGYDYWVHVIITGQDNRPNLVEFSSCKGVEIDSVRMENSPQFHLNLDDCLDVSIHDLTIYVDVNAQKHLLKKHGLLAGPNHPLGIPEGLPTFPLNTDGIDPSGANMTITNVNITNFDDAIAVKPSHAGRKLASCTQNITVDGAYVKYGVGMTIGSVPPNDGCNCVRDIIFRNIYFDHPLKALYVKTNPGDSGTGLIQNILYENIYALKPVWWSLYIGPQQQKQPHSTGTGCSFFYPLPHTQCPTQPRVTITGMTLRNVTFDQALLSPGMMRCNETNPCTDFVFDRVTATSVLKWPMGSGYLCENVSGTSSGSNPSPSCLTPSDSSEF